MTLELAKVRTVIALDLPGHGQSALPPAVWGTADFAAFLGKFADSLGLESFDLLGHSVGGRFGAFLAATQPQRIGKLILASASGIKPKRPLKYYFKVALAKTGKYSERYLGSFGAALKQRIYAKIASPDYRTAGELRSSFVKIVNEDIRADLTHVRAKTLLLWGRDDTDTPLSSAAIMQNVIPGAELVILENAGHYSFLDQPDKFLLHVKKFLR